MQGNCAKCYPKCAREWNDNDRVQKCPLYDVSQNMTKDDYKRTSALEWSGIFKNSKPENEQQWYQNIMMDLFRRIITVVEERHVGCNGCQDKHESSPVKVDPPIRS